MWWSSRSPTCIRIRVRTRTPGTPASPLVPSSLGQGRNIGRPYMCTVMDPKRDEGAKSLLTLGSKIHRVQSQDTIYHFSKDMTRYCLQVCSFPCQLDAAIMHVQVDGCCLLACFVLLVCNAKPTPSRRQDARSSVVADVHTTSPRAGERSKSCCSSPAINSS